MNKFEDRKSSNINRKIFEVEKVEKDESGEIIRIIGTLVRADNPEVEGTPLNAKNLSLLVNKYYVENTTVRIKADGSSSSFATFSIEIAEPLNVSIENNYSDLFSVTVSLESTNEEVILDVEAKKDPSGDGDTEYDFTATLTSKDTGVKRGVITYTVSYTPYPTEGND